MKENEIEVLISTMHYPGENILKKMNLRCNAVIGNQADKEKVEKITFENKEVLIVSTTQRGLSNNRNQTLMRASGTICLLADDDVMYYPDYIEIVKQEFKKYPDADIIIFNIEDHTPEFRRFVNKRPMRVTCLNYMRYGSVRIAFKTKRVKEEGIFFNTRFGAGQEICFGEDTIFLHDCLKKGLKIIASEKYILELSDRRKSTWFRGYDQKYYMSKVYIFKQLSRHFYKLLCLQDAIRHYRMYQEKGWFQCYKKMKKFF